ARRRRQLPRRRRWRHDRRPADPGERDRGRAGAVRRADLRAAPAARAHPGAHRPARGRRGACLVNARPAQKDADKHFDSAARLDRGVFGYETGMANTTIPADGIPLKAYLAIPAGAGPHPGVVVIQDALGLTRAIREHADRLASYGYLAVAPDLYTRGGMLRCVQATFRALLRGEGPAYDDIERSRRWLLGRNDCAGRVGVIGFCMGGGFALMTANRGFDAS